MLLALLAQATPLGGVFGDYEEAIADFAANYRYQFVPMGMNLYHAFAAIVIVWAGVQIALSGSSPDWGKVMKLVLVLAFGSAMVRNFAGGDWSITYLIEGQVRLMCRQFDEQALRQLAGIAVQQQRAAAETFGSMGLANLMAALHFMFVGGVWAIFQAVAWFVVSFGDIACVVCVILGPIFVPFFIVPKLDWLFWGWLKAYLQFAFYKLVATIVTVMVVDGVGRAVQIPPAQASFFHFLPHVAIAIAGMAVLLKVPSLTAHIFSGSAGSDSGLLSMAQGAVSTTIQNVERVASAGA